MTYWDTALGFSIISAAFLLSVMGLWLTAIMPGFARWDKRFFLSYFTVFILCCLSCLADVILSDAPIPRAVLHVVAVLECLFLSLPLPMLTAFLLHFCGEDLRRSRLLHVVLGLWATFLALFVGVSLISSFSYIGSDKWYYFGPGNPLPLLPLCLIPLLNVVGLIRRRRQLSRKAFLAFLVATLPMAGTMLPQPIVDVSLFIDISCVLCALAMYSLILSDQIERDLRFQRELAQQRANVMVLQMRPHYIYNTLMCIYSLCNLDPQKARQTTLDFTNYLRKNFNAVASEAPIPFSEELEHTRAYLAVEQASFEDMLIVEFDTPFTRFRLPPLTLQPIVENAVKHGLSAESGPLHICIRTRCTDVGAEIVVEDTGPGFDPTDEEKPHTALKNIQQRLEMMCDGTMAIEPRSGGGTRVSLTIPDRDAA